MASDYSIGKYRCWLTLSAKILFCHHSMKFGESAIHTNIYEILCQVNVAMSFPLDLFLLTTKSSHDLTPKLANCHP